MDIHLENTGQKYNRSWIFRDLNYHFKAGEGYAITGRNGSGKSTLLQLISGYASPFSGKISWSINKKTVDIEDVHLHISMAAPYIDIPEDFTFEEMLSFHFRFRKKLPGISFQDIFNITGLGPHKDKQLKNYSSGMRQRVLLSLALFSDTPLLLLDEPTSHLDNEGAEWYREMVGKYTGGRLLIISSNQTEEYQFCKNLLNIEDFHLKKNVRLFDLP